MRGTVVMARASATRRRCSTSASASACGATMIRRSTSPDSRRGHESLCDRFGQRDRGARARTRWLLHAPDCYMEKIIVGRRPRRRFTSTRGEGDCKPLPPDSSGDHDLVIIVLDRPRTRTYRRHRTRGASADHRRRPLGGIAPRPRTTSSIRGRKCSPGALQLNALQKAIQRSHRQRGSGKSDRPWITRETFTSATSPRPHIIFALWGHRRNLSTASLLRARPRKTAPACILILRAPHPVIDRSSSTATRMLWSSE